VAKVRVYELAKEFGVESKAVMAKLQSVSTGVPNSLLRVVVASDPRKSSGATPIANDNAIALAA